MMSNIRYLKYFRCDSCIWRLNAKITR